MRGTDHATGRHEHPRSQSNAQRLILNTDQTPKRLTLNVRGGKVSRRMTTRREGNQERCAIIPRPWASASILRMPLLSTEQSRTKHTQTLIWLQEKAPLYPDIRSTRSAPFNTATGRFFRWSGPPPLAP